MNKVLKMKGISKLFPGVKALENVSFDLNRGEVHCLIGANGAGKSTLMKILSGVYEKDEGKLFINDTEVQIETPSQSQGLGISTIYQELSLVEELSVAENIFLGSYLKKGNGFINWQDLNKSAGRILDLLEEKISPKAIVKDLSMGKKQMVEIAKAIALDAKVLIMDEPTTALSGDEIEKLFKVINELRNQGLSIVYISHKLDELYTIGDRITVLRNGKWIITDEIKNINKNDLIRHITGRVISQKVNKESVGKKEIFLEVEHFTNPKLKNVSFNLGRGEILGLYGLVGSGRTELLRALYGADPLEGGEVKLNGKVHKIKTPKDAVKLGMGLVPENRKTEGIVLDLSVRENAILPSLSDFANYSIIDRNKVKRVIVDSIKKMNIKTSGENIIVRNLSGGNQQKVIISKWLIQDSKLLLFDEPTQGIDVGAKDEIYEIIEELSKNNGTSVVIASSEVDELLSVCDRVLVMFEGEIIKEFKNPSSQKSEILNTAVSGE